MVGASYRNGIFIWDRGGLEVGVKKKPLARNGMGSLLASPNHHSRRGDGGEFGDCLEVEKKMRL